MVGMSAVASMRVSGAATDSEDAIGHKRFTKTFRGSDRDRIRLDVKLEAEWISSFKQSPRLELVSC
jgi:hypothetical protein